MPSRMLRLSCWLRLHPVWLSSSPIPHPPTNTHAHILLRTHVRGPQRSAIGVTHPVLVQVLGPA
eukprot:scaffold4007_cov362-Prasinococcus_capsulatus_cf.AAC.1